LSGLSIDQAGSNRAIKPLGASLGRRSGEQFASVCREEPIFGWPFPLEKANLSTGEKRHS
jgi:hypothetical protein